MAKKKIIIPVAIEVDSGQLNKLKQDLTGVAQSTSKALSNNSKEQATKLLSELNNVINLYNEQMKSGKMTSGMEDSFKKTIQLLTKDAISFGKTLKTELKNMDVESLVSPSVKAEFDALHDSIEDSNEEIRKLESADLKNLNDILSEAGTDRNQLGMQENRKSLSAATADLVRFEKEYQRLLAKDPNKLTDKDKEALSILKESATVRQKLIPILEEETRKTTANKIALDAQKEALKQNRDLLKSKTEAERGKLLAGLQNPVEGLVNTNKGETQTKADVLNKQIIELSKGLNIFTGVSNAAKESFVHFLTGIVSGQIIINGLKTIVKATINTVKELDKAFNEIAMVTTYTTKEVWKMKDSFVSIAQVTGMTLSEVTKLAGEFFRQGRSYSEVLKLTEAAGIAARIAGISAGDSVNYLTSAINGYKLSANQALAVSDKFAALAAGSATDYEELAIALSKVAAQAYSAGVNMDNMMGFIAKALETTREAPENIGTAFKTIFARMQELKEIGKTVEDGMDVNRIETALNSIGVALTNSNKELRNLDDVLIDVGEKWTTLTKNQKAYVTTALAGTRQQTRLLAVFEDFDRTMELAEISSNSLGASLAQQSKYQSSIAYAMNELTVSWQNFVSSLVNTDAIILVIGVVNTLVGSLNNVVGAFETMGPVVSALAIALLVLSAAQLKYNIAAKAGEVIQLLNMGSTVKQLLLDKSIVGSIIAKTVATIGNTKAVLANLAAQKASTLIMLGSQAAILGVIAVIAVLALTYESAKKKAEKFGEAMKKSQADLYNTRQKASDLEKLLKRYDEIEASIVKTNEELEEQRNLVQQIQDLAGDDATLVVDGDLDRDAVVDYMKFQASETERIIADAVATAEKSYGTLAQAYIEAGNIQDQTTQTYLITAQAMEDLGKTYDEFLKMSKEEREIAKDRVKLGFELADNAKIMAKYTATDVDANITKTYDSEEEARLGGSQMTGSRISYGTTLISVSLAKESQKFYDELKSIGFFDSNASLTDRTTALNDFLTLEPEVQAGLKSVSSDIANLDTLRIKLLGESGSFSVLSTILGDSDYSLDQISTLSKALEKITTDAGTLRAAITDGPTAAITAFANSGEASVKTVLDLTQTLIDTLSNVTFEKLSLTAKSLNSTYESMEKVNKILSGEAEYDISFMNEMLESYPLLNDMISEGSQLTKEQMDEIAKVKQQEFLDDLTRKEAEIQLTIDTNNAKIGLLQDMLANTAKLDQIAQDTNLDINKDGVVDLMEVQNTYFKDRTANDIKASVYANRVKLEQELATASEIEKIDIQTRLNAAKAAESQVGRFTLDDLGLSDGGTKVGKDWASQINAQISSIMQNNSSLEKQLTNIALIRKRIANMGSLIGSDSSKGSAEKEYIGKLNEIYVLEQQIAMIHSELDKYSFMEKNAKTGEEFVTALAAQNKLLGLEIESTKSLIDAQRRSQELTYSSLGDLQSAVTLVNGRMIPIMSKYVNLTAEQQEILDASVESYNSLTDEIDENSMSVKENTVAIEENLQKIEDKTVEFYNILAEAIKNSEKKKLDELNKGFEAERKLLDERRKMYEDAFAEEDYTDSLKEVTDERADIISQLTELEGASDLASVTKRKDLLNRKAELDKEYNKTVLDYNRDALLELFDEESELIDQREQEYEDAYEERINSVEWLESEITRIMNGGLDSTIQYLKDHSPEYEDAWTITKDNIQGKWEMLYDVINGKVDEIEKNIPDFTNLLAQLAQAAAYVGQINAKPTNPGSPGGPPDTGGGGKRTVYIYNGKEYASEAMALEDKNSEINAIVQQIATLKKQGGSSSMIGQAIQALTAKQNEIIARPITMKQYKKGGLANFTGPAWLDGTKSKPERVLSAVQTELFDKMVQNLEDINSKPGNQTNTSNSSISIENITITTGQLNTSQDFREAGRSIAQEFKNAITERGLNINLKR